MPQRKKEREGEIFLVLSSTYIHFGLARERVVEREGQRERESGSERERENMRSCAIVAIEASVQGGAVQSH